MKHTVIISSEELRNRAFEIIANLPLDPVHAVIIHEHKKERTAAQRGLYWLWITQIAGELGELKDDVHRRMKKKHLIPIYMANPLSGMTETVMAVREVYKQGMKTIANSLANKIIDLVSTNDANVKEFTEYLEQIEKEAIGLGIFLAHPEDIWHEAMGKDRTQK
jgi:hypothetical protein